jgi:DNA-directed RNA polymerase delta subunit
VATTTQSSPIQAFNYRQATEAILRTLRRDRDRQIVARRFGFDLPKRQTLEQIGRHFGITRERVRQIEKATLAKIKAVKSSEVAEANTLLSRYLEAQGGVAAISTIAGQMGATSAEEQAYILFLATLAPDIEVIDEDDSLSAAFGLMPDYNRTNVKALLTQVEDQIRQIGQPANLGEIKAGLSVNLDLDTLANLATISKRLANHEDQWGLVEWPAVNPKSIRDKTYLVLGKHGQPLHFGDIARHIKESNFTRRNVTVQAVHNELIKDPRFVLIGRGIYALAEWGYTPGTVADIIIDILKQESPLHKDEIVKRVLQKRQVKTTTIVLNLQEKEQFERVAKATYKLKGQ